MAKAKAKRWGGREPTPAPTTEPPPRPPAPPIPATLPGGFVLSTHFPDMPLPENIAMDVAALFNRGIPPPPPKPPVQQFHNVPKPPPATVKVVRKAENREEHLMPSWMRQMQQQQSAASSTVPGEGLGDDNERELSPTPVAPEYEAPVTPSGDHPALSISSSPVVSPEAAPPGPKSLYDVIAPFYNARDFLGELDDAPRTPDFDVDNPPTLFVPGEGLGGDTKSRKQISNKIKQEVKEEPRSPTTPTSGRFRLICTANHRPATTIGET